MEPHRNISHNRNKHIEFYVKTYVSICLLCGSKKTVGLVIPIVTFNFIRRFFRLRKCII